LAAEGLSRQLAGQCFSYVDAVSFVLMRRRQIETAFAYDRHFRTVGFRLLADEH
jgi:predicted nucleic acid-binding protein